MKCPYCGYDNPDGSRFCSGCGKKLELQGGNGFRETYPEQPAGYDRQTEYSRNREYNRQTDHIRQREYENRKYKDPYDRRGYASGDPDSRRKGEEKRIILIGVILACVVIVAGVAAYLLINRYLENGESDAQTSSSAVAGDSGDRKTPTETVTPEPTATPTATPTPTPTEEPLTVSLVDSTGVNLNVYTKAGVSEASASSVVQQEGYDNSANMLVDGDVVTSWQEGVDGDGINEFADLKLDREYQVKYITLNLGNWRDQQRYDENNVPKTLTIWLDEKSFQVEFPHEREQFCLEFSEDCPASEIYVRIDDVYKGSLWDDTCISEIGIYGR